MPFVGAQTTAHDWRADTLPAGDVVIVTSIVDLGHFPVGNADDRVAVGAAASDLEATPDEGNTELHAADILVLDLVREKLGPRVEALRAGRNAGAGLERIGVHANNRAAPRHRDVMACRGTRSHQGHD